MKRSQLVLGLLKIPLDFLMVFAGFYFGLELRKSGDFIPRLQLHPLDLNLIPSTNDFFTIQWVAALLLVLSFGFFSLYAFRTRDSLLHELKQVTKHAPVWALIVMAYFFITRNFMFSRLVLIYSLTFSAILVLIGRILLYGIKILFLKNGWGQIRVILLGNNKMSRKLAQVLQKDPRYFLVGIAQKPLDLPELFEKNKVDSLIQSAENLTADEERFVLETCESQQVDYHFVPDVLSMERSNLEFLQFGKIPVLHLRPTSLEGWGKVWKRLIDIIGAFVGLVVLSPLLLIIATAIKLDSKGPALFTQLDDGSPALRIGQYGRPFQFFKFRTMAPNSHNKRYAELAEHNIRKGPIVKIKNDPRVTRLGHFLRRFDLDELPQLWNVLKGDMSLIGPRPHLPEEVKNYQNHHYFLLHIKPGMTGWAQVNGRSDLDFEDEVKLDSYYIRNWSLILDFKILFKTIAVIFQKHQAD